MAEDPIAELRRKFIASLAEAARPTLRQMRVWEFLRWSYRTNTTDRSNVEPIGPADQQWLDEALARLDEFDHRETT
jgi:hypothetical protein